MYETETRTIQEIAENIVRADVYCNISQHIMRLLDGPDADSWIDDLAPALTVDDWETPVLDALAELEQEDVQTLLDAAGVAGLEPHELPSRPDWSKTPDWPRARDSAIQAIREVARCLEHPHESADLWREIAGDVLSIDDPQTEEALEFWLVSDHLAERLEQQGEPVGELDGVALWGRTCSGQAITNDGPILNIARQIARA